MTKRSVTINLKNGLEPRPVALLVQKASQHESSVYIESENKRVNAKSIMGMMSLSLNSGDVLTVEADGTDEGAAVSDIESFLKGESA